MPFPFGLPGSFARSKVQRAPFTTTGTMAAVARALAIPFELPSMVENNWGMFSATRAVTQYCGRLVAGKQGAVNAGNVALQSSGLVPTPDSIVTFCRPPCPPAVKPACAAYRQPFERFVSALAGHWV